MRLMGLSDDSSDHDDSSNQRIRRRGKSSLELAKKCPSCVDGRARERSAPRLSQIHPKLSHAVGLAVQLERLPHVSAQNRLVFSDTSAFLRRRGFQEDGLRNFSLYGDK